MDKEPVSVIKKTIGDTVYIIENTISESAKETAKSEERTHNERQDFRPEFFPHLHIEDESENHADEHRAIANVHRCILIARAHPGFAPHREASADAIHQGCLSKHNGERDDFEE